MKAPGRQECALSLPAGRLLHLHAALITALNVVIIAFAMYLVGRARGEFHIQATATTGNVDSERVFRAHQNTLEQTAMFLPLLWLASLGLLVMSFLGLIPRLLA